MDGTSRRPQITRLPVESQASCSQDPLLSGDDDKCIICFNKIIEKVEVVERRVHRRGQSDHTEYQVIDTGYPVTTCRQENGVEHTMHARCLLGFVVASCKKNYLKESRHPYATSVSGFGNDSIAGMTFSSWGVVSDNANLAINMRCPHDQRELDNVTFSDIYRVPNKMDDPLSVQALIDKTALIWPNDEDRALDQVKLNKILKDLQKNNPKVFAAFSTLVKASDNKQIAVCLSKKDASELAKRLNIGSMAELTARGIALAQKQEEYGFLHSERAEASSAHSYNSGQAGPSSESSSGVFRLSNVFRSLGTIDRTILLTKKEKELIEKEKELNEKEIVLTKKEIEQSKQAAESQIANEKKDKRIKELNEGALYRRQATEALEKENEELKKENEELKKENDLLKVRSNELEATMSSIFSGDNFSENK